MASSSRFHFPVHAVSNDRVKLIPLNLDRHLDTFFRLSVSHPELYAHMPIGPFNSLAELKAEFLDRSTSHILSFSNPESIAFAVIDKTRPASPEDPEGELAGTVSFIRTSPVNLCTEIGFILILPPYQRSHVATNTVGLALKYAFETPENGGLGLRRIHWQASAANPASAKLAEKMGFEKIGLTPWHIRFIGGREKGKIGNGKEPPAGTDSNDLWRDTFSFTLAWDQWGSGGKENAERIMMK
ncbi:Acyl-CoA N-acyltransferase [Penicillium cosmopolitanum]|uniref:Acyl-CoA N-acyltransferase n=1 Tax=Penicillium cosmopolitanum TaxID=1131564 RepID=A0A9W9VRP8_9EURO|nr:Acyl-CoA N-acyltransferase [Penicillium cosmopolitanum]KAJ5388126.1 Acyl-CoA N-acyltransferase [Penicillium cosmopolitanum]